VEALQRGKLIEAIKLLRASGIGLKEAKDAIAAHMNGTPAPAVTPSGGFSANVPGAPLPAAVVAALEQGNKIEAIKLLRQQTGLGLNEAKDAVDAYDHTHARSGGLSPGQVPDSSSGMWVVVLILACVIGYWFLRRLT
jgi:ribosomal protein L7/L12